jgi:hypothetical protein
MCQVPRVVFGYRFAATAAPDMVSRPQVAEKPAGFTAIGPSGVRQTPFSGAKGENRFCGAAGAGARAPRPCRASPAWDSGDTGPWWGAVSTRPGVASESRGVVQGKAGKRRAHDRLGSRDSRASSAPRPPPLAQLSQCAGQHGETTLMDQCRYKSLRNAGCTGAGPRRWGPTRCCSISRGPVLGARGTARASARLLDKHRGARARRVIQRLRARGALANGRLGGPRAQRLELWVHPQRRGPRRAMRFRARLPAAGGSRGSRCRPVPRVEAVTTPVPALRPASPLPRTDKEHRIQWRLNNGERLGPLVKLLPLPWQTEPSLCGPFLYSANGDAVDRALRRQARSRNNALPGTRAPRLVRGVVPPFKHLRGPLADAVKAIGAADAAVLADILECCATQLDTHGREIELAEPLPDILCRPRHPGQFSERRAPARGGAVGPSTCAQRPHANGGLVAPHRKRVQVLLNEDGLRGPRACAFAAGYQASPARPMAGVGLEAGRRPIAAETSASWAAMKAVGAGGREGSQVVTMSGKTLGHRCQISIKIS